MLNTSKTLYSLDDVTIIPCKTTTLSSRSECYPFTTSIEGESNYYPLIAAPMSSVVSPDNYNLFHEAGISCVIPRNIPIEERLKLCMNVMCAFSLQETITHFIDHTYNLVGGKLHVLIDIANGHMIDEIEIGKKLKEIYGENIVLMGGNIGNPLTFLEYNKAGFDYVRVGIGGGLGCLTSTQTGIHYPMASLLDDIICIMKDNYILYKRKRKTKIVADGGIRGYSDIIKCLALGADYVMCGSIFAKSKEACGKTSVIYDPETGNPQTFRQYYGMSTKQAQAEILGFKDKEDAKNNNAKLKTAEGKCKYLPVEYSLKDWTENFESYLRSTMSYTGYRNLIYFKGGPELRVISGTSGNLINNK